MSMAGFWRRLFERTATTCHRIEHPALGSIEFDPEEDSWSATPKVGDQQVRFLIGGKDAPDPTLLAQAVAILEDFDRFCRTVHEFLKREAMARPRFTQEILQLRVADVCLFWSDRPNDSMIYFSGPDRFRVWHCDYVNREPVALAFDS